MFHSRRRFSTGVAAAGLGLTSLGARAQDADASLVDAAKKEGSVVVYSGHPGHPAIGANFNAFERRYGVRVDLLEGRANELRERIRSEQATGRFVSDVSLNGMTTTTLQAAAGVFQPYGSLKGTDRVIDEFKPTDTVITAYGLGYAILVNTNLVKPQDEPKSWKDLLDPRWKGKILGDDPRAVGGGSHFFQASYRAFGVDYHKQLAGQEMQITRERAAAERRVARGEYPLFFPQSLSTVPALKGLPIKLVIPEEGLVYVPFQMAMFRNAPHPNAARLLMNYYLGDEAQLAHANVGDIVAIKGIAERADPVMRERAAARLFGTTVVSTQDELLALAKEIYK